MGTVRCYSISVGMVEWVMCREVWGLSGVTVSVLVWWSG